MGGKVKRRNDQLRCTTLSKASVVRREVPFEFVVSMANTGSEPLHVSRGIRSYELLSDNVLQVSTAIPDLDTTKVQLAFQPLPDTVLVGAGETLDQPFCISFPLRIAKFTGEIPRIETEEWMPRGDFEIRLTLAYGLHPFHPPARRSEIPRALREWENLVEIPPLRVTAKDEKEARDGIDQ